MGAKKQCMRHAAEPVAKDMQCRTAQSYPKLQNTRERKNTKRSVILVSLATVYSRKKKHGHALFFRQGMLGMEVLQSSVC